MTVQSLARAFFDVGSCGEKTLDNLMLGRRVFRFARKGGVSCFYRQV